MQIDFDNEDMVTKEWHCQLMEEVVVLVVVDMDIVQVIVAVDLHSDTAQEKEDLDAGNYIEDCKLR
jgi:hypothetical protein